MQSSADEYRFSVDVAPAYVRATATGPRTPENASRFLQEAYAACLRAGRDAVLLEMNLEGPALDPSAIFKVISGGTAEALKLRRIAYVDRHAASRAGPQFATTVAANRGVNVRLFGEVAAAKEWLDQAG